MAEGPAEPCLSMLSFDVVIATRNRPEALALSIPLILSQSRLPLKLIVIDSSDDHVPVAETVQRATQGWDGTVIVEHSEKGLPLQRNRGLRHVTADVVIFPDDDSLFQPGTSKAIMDVYEADTDRLVSAVCAAETMTPPEGVLEASEYEMTEGHVREASFRRLRNRIEKRLLQLNPMLYLGQLLMQRHTQAALNLNDRCRPVEYMTGFRMSFRTDVIKASGFDQTLPGYALLEDIDASLAAAGSGLLVGALDAKIFHHRFPGGRGDMFTWGFFSIFNRAYLTEKHLATGLFSEKECRTARSHLRWFIRTKLLLSAIGAKNGAGRDQLRGAVFAAREARRFVNTKGVVLSDEYSAVWSKLHG